MSQKIATTIEADSLQEYKDTLLGLASMNGGTTPPPGGGTTPPPATGDDSLDPNDWSDAKVEAEFFPPDFADAKSPSPESAFISIDPDGTYHGKPYLVDLDGAVWLFPKDASGNYIKIPSSRPPDGWKSTVNGIQAAGMGQLKLFMAQGRVYMVQAPGGQVQKHGSWNQPGTGTFTVAPPPDWQDEFYGYKNAHGIGGGGSSGGGSTGGVPLKQDPPPQAVAFGSTGKVILFGPDQPLTGPAAACATAAPGDVVKASDAARGVVYHESFDVGDCVTLDLNAPGWTDIAGAWAALKAGDVAGFRAHWQEGAIIDGQGVPQSAYSHQLAGVVIVNNGKIINGHVRNWQPFTTPAHDGSAGIRFKGSANGKFVGNNLFVEGCQNGIGPGGTVVQTDISHTILYNNTGRDGGAHNIYNTGSCSKDWFGPDFYSWCDPAPAGESSGHALKTRASVTTFLGPVELYAGDATPLDIADGSGVSIKIVSGVRLIKRAGDANHDVLGYAVENGGPNGKVGVQFLAGSVVDAPSGVCGFITAGPIVFDTGVQFPQGGVPKLNPAVSGGSLNGPGLPT